jgi:hypothetical protein
MVERFFPGTEKIFWAQQNGASQFTDFFANLIAMPLSAIVRWIF